MIGTTGQWVMSFSIGDDLRDFISGSELRTFTLIEEAGGALPTFEISFQTNNNEVLGYLNEGQILKVSYGKSIDDLFDAHLKMSKPLINRLGEGGFIISFMGLEQSTAYLSSPNQQLTAKQSGLTTVLQVAGKHFEIDTTIGSSLDQQVWIQPYTSDRAFLTHTWLHSDMGDGDLPLIAVCSDGVFRMRNLKSLLATKPAHTFSYEGAGDNIVIEGDYTIQLSDGILNQFAGYGLQQNIYDLNSGTSSEHTTDIQPMMAFTNTLNRDSSIEPKRLPNGAKNDNVHPRFNEAYANNLAGLSTFSSCKVKLNYMNELRDVRVLDLVMFKDDALRVVSDGQSSHKQTQDHYTGLYIVSKVARTVENNQLAVYVELVRESPSEMTGNLR